MGELWHILSPYLNTYPPPQVRNSNGIVYPVQAEPSDTVGDIIRKFEGVISQGVEEEAILLPDGRLVNHQTEHPLNWRQPTQPPLFLTHRSLQPGKQLAGADGHVPVAAQRGRAGKHPAAQRQQRPHAAQAVDHPAHLEVRFFSLQSTTRVTVRASLSTLTQTLPLCSLGAVVRSKWFNFAVLAVVFCNTAVLAMDRANQSEGWEHAFEIGWFF